MKKTYKIEVDCANCANLMEDAAKKTGGVEDAVVNFMTQKNDCTVRGWARAEVGYERCAESLQKIEPDCEIEF